MNRRGCGKAAYGPKLIFVEMSYANLCLPPLFFFVGNVIDDLRLTPNRGRVVRRVDGSDAACTNGTSRLEKEEEAHFIMPSLQSGQVQFFTPAAIWAALQSKSAHDGSFTFRPAAVLDAGTLKNLSLPVRWNCHGTTKAVSLALGTVWLQWEKCTVSSCSRNRSAWS